MPKAGAFVCLSVSVFVGAAAVGAAVAQPAADTAKIASAMRAAPASVAKQAGVMDVGADGSMRELRKGTNGFTCMPDNPATPGPDPMCGDSNAMEWAHAWITRKPPPAQKVGFMYMLEGGTDASNTDPYAKAPTAGNNWVETGPHVMIVGSPTALAAYPRSPKPDTASPYVMWAGTPYEHLMIPVK
jgi:hypothetical protein